MASTSLLQEANDDTSDGGDKIGPKRLETTSGISAIFNLKSELIRKKNNLPQNNLGSEYSIRGKKVYIIFVTSESIDVHIFLNFSSAFKLAS